MTGFIQYNEKGFVRKETRERIHNQRVRKVTDPFDVAAWQRREQEPIVICESCGQWGATYTPCKHCGAPIGV